MCVVSNKGNVKVISCQMLNHFKSLVYFSKKLVLFLVNFSNIYKLYKRIVVLFNRIQGWKVFCGVFFMWVFVLNHRKFILIELFDA